MIDYPMRLSHSADTRKDYIGVQLSQGGHWAVYFHRNSNTYEQDGALIERWKEEEEYSPGLPAGKILDCVDLFVL